MRLTDLDPRWCCDAEIVIGGIKQHFENRRGMAVSFECPCCAGRESNDPKKSRLAVWFANPIDGLPPTDDAKSLWHREGESFENLTLSPSVDASEFGHWHGFIRNGEVT